MRTRGATLLVGAAVVLLVIYAQVVAQQKIAVRAFTDGDWPRLAGDYAGQKYSKLKQIDTTNVSKLVSAWTFEGVGAQQTPIVVDGVMYASTSTGVVALDADTGKLIWRYGPVPTPGAGGGRRGGRGAPGAGAPGGARRSQRCRWRRWSRRAGSGAWTRAGGSRWRRCGAGRSSAGRTSAGTGARRWRWTRSAGPDSSRPRRSPFEPRCRLLARRRHDSTSTRDDGGTPSRRVDRQHGRARRVVRHRRVHRHGRELGRRAARLQEHRHRRRVERRDHPGPEPGRYESIRCAHGREAMEFRLSRAAGRPQSRAGLAGRGMEEPARGQSLGLVPHAR